MVIMDVLGCVSLYDESLRVKFELMVIESLIFGWRTSLVVASLRSVRW
jgi:hypothetical protein